MKRKTTPNGQRKTNWLAIILTLLLAASLGYAYYLRKDARDGRELAVMTEQESMAQRDRAEKNAKEATRQKARADRLAGELEECRKSKK